MIASMVAGLRSYQCVSGSFFMLLGCRRPRLPSIGISPGSPLTRTPEGIRVIPETPVLAWSGLEEDLPRDGPARQQSVRLRCAAQGKRVAMARA